MHPLYSAANSIPSAPSVIPASAEQLEQARRDLAQPAEDVLRNADDLKSQAAENAAAKADSEALIASRGAVEALHREAAYRHRANAERVAQLEAELIAARQRDGELAAEAARVAERLVAIDHEAARLHSHDFEPAHILSELRHFEGELDDCRAALAHAQAELARREDLLAGTFRAADCRVIAPPSGDGALGAAAMVEAQIQARSQDLIDLRQRQRDEAREHLDGILRRGQIAKLRIGAALGRLHGLLAAQTSEEGPQAAATAPVCV